MRRHQNSGKRARRIILLAVALVGIIGWVALPENLKRMVEPSAQAATFVVTNTNDSGAGSLRAAILNANSNGTGTIDNITFNIPGGGVHTIKPLTALPEVTTATIIDGYSQPGASANTLNVGNNAVLLIELDGSLISGQADGITLSAAASYVKGLAIHSFYTGIRLKANEGHVRGNIIGLPLNGSAPSDIQSTGVVVEGSFSDIGWVTAADRNVISKFGQAIGFSNDNSQNNSIYGNYIGTNVPGTMARGNSYGISLRGTGHTVGNATVLGRNLISGNGVRAISMTGQNHKIHGNHIGLSSDGLRMDNGGDGITLFGASGVTIGGAGTGNIIVACKNGIHLVSFDNKNPENNIIKGNYIGTDTTGKVGLGNTENGILLDAGANKNIIGGTAAGEANTIQSNWDSGISSIAGSDSNTFSANSIYFNQFNGIDLSPTTENDRVTLNDPGDFDIGPNGLQNFPVLTSVQNSGGITTINGTLNSSANTQFNIEFFASPSCDLNGYGEGQTYLGSTTVTTVGNDVTFSKALPGFNAGQFVTATATGPSGRTSEFSQCVYVVSPAAGTLAFSSATYTVNENVGTATITVKRVGGSTGAVTVKYATPTGGTATNLSDYQSTSGFLSWDAGDMSDKTFTVTILNDAFNEPAETINLSLTTPTGGAALGSPDTASISITDDDPQPSFSVSDVSVTEGNSGTTSAVFTVTLSSASNQTLKVDFATADGTAAAVSDYQTQGGTLTFNPGDLTKTITVAVNGDAVNEANETFAVNLSNPQNATIADGQGIGSILNDDSPGVQFSTNAFSFSEGAGHGDIIITRTGDTSAPLDVDYASSDQSGMTPCQTNNTGFASERCDYATAAGTIRFAAGETQKTIALVLIDDAYMEGSEQLTLKLTNPAGGALGSTDTATITITDNDAQLAQANPIDDLDFFIRQQYIDFLGREPDAAGFQFWKSRMTNSCPAGETCDRIDTSFKFFQSDEFRERGYFVYLFYHAALGRRPTYAEWIQDVSRLNGLKTVAEQEAAKEAFINEFMSRQEFMNLYNGAQTGQTFLDALVQKSGVTPASKQALIDNYANVGRAKTLRAFIETTEVQAHFFDNGFVTMLYFGYLRRDAEPGGFDFWMQQLNNTNHNYRFMVGGFLQSDE